MAKFSLWGAIKSAVRNITSKVTRLFKPAPRQPPQAPPRELPQAPPRELPQAPPIRMLEGEKWYYDVTQEQARYFAAKDARRPVWRIIARHGVFKLSVFNPEISTLLARYNNAVRSSLYYNDNQALQEFEGVTLVIQGKRYTLETRPEALKELHEVRGKGEIIDKPVKYKGKKR